MNLLLLKNPSNLKIGIMGHTGLLPPSSHASKLIFVKFASPVPAQNQIALEASPVLRPPPAFGRLLAGKDRAQPLHQLALLAQVLLEPGEVHAPLPLLAQLVLDLSTGCQHPPSTIRGWWGGSSVPNSMCLVFAIHGR